MKNSRIPILFNTPAELKNIEVFCCSDMHNGSAQFDERAWQNIEKLLEQENKYIIFAGDQCEYATRSSKSDVYEQRLRPAEQKRWWVQHLEPYKHKILCIVDGNHEFNRASKDADDFPLYDIALALGIEDVYRSEGAIVDIGVGDGGHGKGKQVHYVGRVQHRAQQLKNYGTSDMWEGIDFIIYGHDHRPSDIPRGKLVYDTKNKCIIEKDVENIDCGSFLTFGGYGERNGYRAASSKKYSLILDGKKKNIETRGFHL